MQLSQPIEIKIINPHELESVLPALSTLLHTCLHAGASIGFILPFPVSEAHDFWQQRVFPAVKEGHLILFAAYAGQTLVGTVQLDLNTMPNQPHRAEVAKLMVDPAFRRRGIARSLMQALETEAKYKQRTLLTLDTRTGDSAEPLYISLGFETVGSIPDFAVDSHDGRHYATTILYKKLPAQAG